VAHRLHDRVNSKTNRRQGGRKGHDMRRYLPTAPKQDCSEEVRLVHNFYPGPHDDPGRDRPVGLGGFRIWITDEPNPNERRCCCGWLAAGREHQGTVGYVDEHGVRWWRGAPAA
jgi:hypothetical protein